MSNSATTKRPTGVTIIGILSIIGGIVMLIAGISLVTLAAVVPILPLSDGQINSQLANTGMSTELLGIISSATGGLFLILGIASLIVAYGLFKAKKWAWTISVVLSVVSIAMGIVSVVTGNIGAIASIAISGLILYYLYRPHVKAYFGKPVQPQVASQ
ncbi:MAG TPA: hypothetical protein VIE86_01115 [Nitrososphaera sp.]|jgi:uncharacterized membrane protein (DUF2068 family)